MDEFPNTNGYSFKWTQPYLPVSYNPFYERKTDIAEEMARIEMVDNWVNAMLTFPDAERILNKIRKESK
tara:strand:- start:203 stop:409 length:207 start_codon:yes stop_codon:yes gene_type:complete